jgi:hypothetical protein
MKKFICLLILSLCSLSCTSRGGNPAPALRQPLIKQHLVRQFQATDIANNYLKGMRFDTHEVAKMEIVALEIQCTKDS